MKYPTLACVAVTALFIGCIGGQTSPYGPFPSPPLSGFLGSGDPMALPIGTPKPSVPSSKFVLTVQNEDDGGAVDAQGTETTPDAGTNDPTALNTSLVEITRIRDGEQLGLVELGPCELLHAVIECLDRPVSLTVIFPDSTVSTRIIPAGDTCIDREFFLLRTVTSETTTTTGTDDTTTDETTYFDVYSLSEANTNPRCSESLGTVAGFGG